VAGATHTAPRLPRTPGTFARRHRERRSRPEARGLHVRVALVPCCRSGPHHLAHQRPAGDERAGSFSRVKLAERSERPGTSRPRPSRAHRAAEPSRAVARGRPGGAEAGPSVRKAGSCRRGTPGDTSSASAHPLAQGGGSPGSTGIDLVHTGPASRKIAGDSGRAGGRNRARHDAGWTGDPPGLREATRDGGDDHGACPAHGPADGGPAPGGGASAGCENADGGARPAGRSRRASRATEVRIQSANR
jgi:hypothetical protein